MNKWPTTEELYEDMPDVFKDIFWGKKKEDKKEDKKEEWKTPFEILQETLRNIQAINKR